MWTSSLSTAYVRLPIHVTESGVAIDPTADPVYVAFIEGNGDPAEGDWQSAVWETADSKYMADCLVGPNGTIALAPGTYVPWVKITDDPEIPVLRSDGLVNVT